MPTAQKAELSLVRNVDTAGKADTLLRKLYVAVAVPIAERNLKYLIPEREFSGKAYNIDAYKTYPAMRIIPELRRNGFKGAFHELTPYEFFTAILTDSKKETLLKAGQTEMFRYAVISNVNLHEYWNSIKICIRNGYHIADASMWCDLVRLLRHLKRYMTDLSENVKNRLKGKERSNAGSSWSRTKRII